MRLRRRRCALALAALGLPGLPSPRAEPALREVHGASDAYAEPGLALAWAVVRGRDESETRVVIRIEADPRRHARWSVTGRDPFGGGSVERLAPAATSGAATLDIARSQFANFPRTELRFFAPEQGTPHLLVYYLGVPDTTPEFTSATLMAADLQARLARARSALR